MNQLPDFWRTEIWHPLSVHFPIAFLLFATVLFFISLFLKKKSRQAIKNMGFIVLAAGVISAWIAIYTGDMADGVVAREICDPTALKDHENAAYLSTILFSVTAFLELILKSKVSVPFHSFLKPLVLVLLLAGSIGIIYAGHAGASVVYQQAGGVYTPSEECDEF